MMMTKAVSFAVALIALVCIADAVAIGPVQRSVHEDACPCILVANQGYCYATTGPKVACDMEPCPDKYPCKEFLCPDKYVCVGEGEKYTHECILQERSQKVIPLMPREDPLWCTVVNRNFNVLLPKDKKY